MTVTLAVLAVAICVLAAPAASQPQELPVGGETSLNGIFDPSLEFAPGGPSRGLRPN